MAKNKDEEVVVDDSEDTSGELRVYELGFHLDPELPVEEVKKTFQGIRTEIEKSATIVAEVEPRKMALAYTISRQEVGGRRDFSSAYFAWIVYEVQATGHKDIIASAGATKTIIRFIDLVTTKEDARHALELNEMLEKTPENEDADSQEVVDDGEAVAEEAV